MELGKTIQTLREKAGMTREELAEAAGVSFEMIKSIELNRREGKLPILQKIAKGLNKKLIITFKD